MKVNELKTKYFTDLSSLVCEKDDLRRKHDEWTKRQEIMRDFYNGQPIMSEGDADEENLETVTNHLIGYANMQIVETRLYSMWSTSNKLIDVDVLLGDAEQREIWSSKINKDLNRAIYKTTRFGAYWRSVCGEISMAGRAACIHKEDSDWCPSVQPKIMLPDSVGTDSSELTYAFTPRELTLAHLEEMLADDESDEDEDDIEIGNEIELNKPIIRQLIETIREQIESSVTIADEGSENEGHDPVNTDKVTTSNKTTANLWYYYEVRFDEDANSKVVDLLIFTDSFRSKADEGTEEATHEWVAFYPAFYSHPSQWCHLIVVDSSIGGDKRFATAKGLAEITYNSDLDTEELVNRIYEGEKLRAIPRFQPTEAGGEEKLLGWDPSTSAYVPNGIAEFNFRGSTGGLNNPLGILRQNSSSLAGSSHSNSGRDGELRTQSLERQANTQATSSSRVSDLQKSMEIIAQEIVRRFFVGEVDGGSPGYEDVMWFRSRMKKAGINLEELAEQTFGYYDNIEVKIVKSSNTGEIDHDVAVAKELMANIGNFPAAVRPIIVRRFATLLTGDPEFSDQLLQLLPRIVSAQRVTSESEFDQISRDASVGIETPLGEDDVHLEHIPVHIKHLRVILQRAKLRSWTREDVVHFVGIQLHAMKHFDEVILNPSSQAEGERFLQEFQQLIAEADSLKEEVEASEAEAGGKTAEEVKMQLALAEQQRKQQETQIKAADAQSVIENRKNRQRGVDRKADQQFLLQKAQLEQKQQQQ